MHGESLALFWTMFRFVVITVIAQFVIALLRELTSFGTPLAIVSALVWLLPAYMAHMKMLVKREDDDDEDSLDKGDRVLGFVWRTLVVCLPVALFAGIVWLISGGMSSDAGGGGAATGFSILAAVVAFPFAFTFFGTWLPSFIAGEDATLKQAVTRGWARVGWLFGHLLLGPVGLFAVTVIIAIISVDFVQPSLLGAYWSPNFLTILLWFIVCLIQAWAVVMTVWIVTTAFLKSKGRA